MRALQISLIGTAQMVDAIWNLWHNSKIAKLPELPRCKGHRLPRCRRLRLLLNILWPSLSHLVQPDKDTLKVQPAIMIVAETMIWERSGHVTKGPTWLGHFLQSRKPPQLAETGRGGRSVDGRSQSAVLVLVLVLAPALVLLLALALVLLLALALVLVLLLPPSNICNVASLYTPDTPL